MSTDSQNSRTARTLHRVRPSVRPSVGDKINLLILSFNAEDTMTTLLSPLLSGLTLDKDEYIDLLTKLIGESVHVQNNPRQGLVSVW